MKSFRVLLLALLPAWLILSAFQPATAAREVRSLAAFTEVRLSGSAKVVLRQGSPQKVEVEGADADLARLETTVTAGKLHIGTKNEKTAVEGDGGILSRVRSTTDYAGMGPVTVYITVPAVTALAVSGSGSIRAAEAIQGKALALTVSGSGSINLKQVEAMTVQVSLSGSGAVVLAGSAPNFSASVSGSGSVAATDLRTETSNVRLSGSGNCRLTATKTLDARIAGSGSVYVSGNPQVNSSTAGSGRVRRS